MAGKAWYWIPARWHRNSTGNTAAADLLLASSHLIRNEVYLLDRLEHILERSSKRFSPEQAGSLLSLMTRTGTLESAINEEQHKLIAATENYFEKLFKRQRQWNPETLH
jgi:hypothetical protein